MRRFRSTGHFGLGFTPVGILFGMALLSFLAAYVFFAIDPVAKLSETRNAQRQFDVNVILKAVYQAGVDAGGAFPASITEQDQYICMIEWPSCNGVSLEILVPHYVASIPVDPSIEGGMVTGYQIRLSAGRVVVSAPHAELEQVVSVTR